ncbi:MAG: hypothetical protein QM774_06780 [Gordonia sp. (in: high G+C Gram-positive bacteria)]|uniref:hypothetical protein n=1 Tax=Gordonia sp. (in: high G+C Gram-positive bacteria) TaxID=84139 RepID=UPI0039E25A93
MKTTNKLTLILGAVATVLAVCLAVAAVLLVRSGSGGSKDAPSAATEQLGPIDGLSPGSQAPNNGGNAPQAPVAGAYPGAGGPRPATAQPMPTETKSGADYAYLLTPSGNIGCDFSTQNEYTRQGQCGVKSMNDTSSPLGTEQLAGSTKGRWLFQFSDNRVGEPVGSSGTTGWMNQPSSKITTAAYGQQYYFEDWVAASEESGLTVWNTQTGSGVFLSREKAERFDGPGGQGSPQQSSNKGEPIVLGSMPSNGRGYGTERPQEVYAGGDPSSRITGITWSSWGGDRAEGTGAGTYQTAGKPSEQGVPATIVASDPGECAGKRAYTKVTYYFPSKGEAFGSRSPMNACWTR